MIVDSDVIIEVLRGNSKTSKWLKKVRASETTIRYSPVSRAEIRAGARPNERAVISAFFDSMSGLPVDDATADLAGDQLARYARSHNVQLGDALIAAAAIEHGEKLATFNSRHFPGVKKIIKPGR